MSIEENIAVIRSSICRDLTDSEFELFVATARRLGLDPLARQIYFSRRWDGKRGENSMVIQVSIDGLRMVAARTGEYEGQVGPLWCGADGEWKDVWLSSEPPVAAKVGVFRRGFREPAWGVARWDSYAQRTKDGKISSFWAKMPDLMLAKCAESLAIRKAFPEQTSGVYTAEEMAQASNPDREEPHAQIYQERPHLVLVDSEKWSRMSQKSLGGVSFDELDDDTLRRLAAKSDEVLAKWGVERRSS